MPRPGSGLIRLSDAINPRSAPPKAPSSLVGRSRHLPHSKVLAGLTGRHRLSYWRSAPVLQYRLAEYDLKQGFCYTCK